MIFDVSECENKIGYTFNDKTLLRKCFTHSSYAYEHKTDDNELLEFFGDAIIEYVVTEYLFKNAYGDEGKLTAIRSEIVSKTPLLNSVRKLGLAEFALLGNGQTKSINDDDKLYSSLYEAVVAGIYLDGGIVPVKKFIKDTIIADYELNKKNKARKAVKKSTSDFKSAFQEYVQKNKLGSITYETLSKKGPDHMPEFRVAALLNGTRLAEGKGSSKKSAENQAAEKALAKLKNRE